MSLMMETLFWYAFTSLSWDSSLLKLETFCMKPPKELAFKVPIYLFPLRKKEVASNKTAVLSGFQAAMGAELMIGGNELSFKASLIPVSLSFTNCGFPLALICTNESVLEKTTCSGLDVRCPA